MIAAGVMVALCAGALTACGAATGAEGTTCAGVAEVADALGEIQAAEGDLLGASRSFDGAAAVFDRVRPPAALERDWPVAAAALRYYAGAALHAARDQGGTVRSDSDAERWRDTFERITTYGVDRCGTGWRTAFDACRAGPPPAAASTDRVFFPCV